MISLVIGMLMSVLAADRGGLEIALGSTRTAVERIDKRGRDSVSQTCTAARAAIESRRFIGWRGLPTGCSPKSLFGVALNDQWGEAHLGQRFEPARSHLLPVPGYYSPAAYVRDGVGALFDGSNPVLEGGWSALSADLGEPQARLDWVHSTVAMPAGELVYAARGITVFLNPENDAVVHVSLYAATTVDDYIARLRLHRQKRPWPRR